MANKYRYLTSLVALAAAGTVVAAPATQPDVQAEASVVVSDAVRARLAQGAAVMSVSAGQLLDVNGVGWGQPWKEGSWMDALFRVQVQYSDPATRPSYAEVLAAV